MVQIKNIRIVFQTAMFALLQYGGIFGLFLTPVLLPVFVDHNLKERMVTCAYGTLLHNLTLAWPVIPLAALSSLFIIPLFLGRLTCSWVCPLGFLQHLLTRIRNFFKMNEVKFSRKTHESLSDIKYVYSFFLLLTAASIGGATLLDVDVGTSYKSLFPLTMGLEPLCPVCPAPALFFLVPDVTKMSLGIGPSLDLVPSIPSLVAASMFLIGAFMISGAYCKYVCPQVVLFSWINKYSLTYIHKDIEKCDKCGVCVRCCPMASRKPLEEERNVRVSDSHCSLCLCCVEKCPENALEAKIWRFTILSGHN